ncbi:MAG: ABC transporter ATP-binding protein, partial [Clostridia bacterium]|nr:ABC transporter ATP-binding protein [Clostridia bacterium]
MREYYPLIVVGALIGVFTSLIIIAFCLKKDKKASFGFERKMKDTELIRRLFYYVKPYIWQFVLACAIMLFTIAFAIVSPMIVANIESIVKQDAFEFSEVIKQIIIYVSILVVSLVSVYLNSVILQKTGQKVISNIREDLFKHIQSLSHEQLNSMPVGKLVTRVTNDTASLAVLFTSIINNILKYSLLVIGVLVAMFSINYELALVVLCFAPFIVLFTLIFRKFSRSAYRKVKDGTTDINTFLSENLSGMKIIQIFNREKKKLEEFKDKNEKLAKARRDQIFVFSIFRPSVYMLYISSIICLFFFGARGALDGTTVFGQAITSETIVAFYMYITKFFDPIQTIAEQFNAMQASFASAEKIFTIFDIKPDVVDEEGAIELDNIKGDIEFKDVWFYYVENEWVLKGVSFKVNA